MDRDILVLGRTLTDNGVAYFCSVNSPFRTADRHIAEFHYVLAACGLAVFSSPLFLKHFHNATRFDVVRVVDVAFVAPSIRRRHSSVERFRLLRFYRWAALDPWTLKNWPPWYYHRYRERYCHRLSPAYSVFGTNGARSLPPPTSLFAVMLTYHCLSHRDL